MSQPPGHASPDDTLSFSAQPPEQVVGSYTAFVAKGATVEIPLMRARRYAVCASSGRGHLIANGLTLQLKPRQWVTLEPVQCIIQSAADSDLLVTLLTLDIA